MVGVERRRFSASFSLLVLEGALLMGCGLETDSPPNVDSTGSCQGSFLEPLPDGRLFAVLLSDYSSSAIAIIDEEGNLLDERWIDSGTGTPGLVATLSGDLAFPSMPDPSGRLVLLDRFRVDVATVLCVPSGALLGQARVQEDRDTSYSANPQDWIGWRGGAWVTRFEPDPGAGRGDDLIEIRLPELERGRRIDLSVFETTGPGGEKIYARPSRGVVLGDRLLVGLARLDATFTHAAEGAVAWVDPDEGTVEAALLEGMANCSHVSLGEERAVVGCLGDTVFSGRNRRERSGWAVFDAEGLVERWSPGTEGPAAVDFPVLAGNAVVAVERSDANSLGRDRLFATFQGDEGAAPVLLGETSPFAFGTPYVDGDGDLWVPDAQTSALRRFSRGEGRWAEGLPIPLGGDLGLPPRAVVPIGRR